MSEALIEILKSTPEAGAILITVFAFLKAMARRDKEYSDSRDRHVQANQEQAQAWATALRDITRENVNAIKECSVALTALREAIHDKRRG